MRAVALPVTGAERDLSYLHCPFLDAENYLTAAAWLRTPDPDTVRSLRLKRRQEARPPTPRERQALDLWLERGFDDEQRREWLKAGLGLYDSHVAAQCLVYGLHPDRLPLVLDGRRIGERLRSGETPASVAALLMNEESPSDRASS